MLFYREEVHGKINGHKKVKKVITCLPEFDDLMGVQFEKLSLTVKEPKIANNEVDYIYLDILPQVITANNF